MPNTSISPFVYNLYTAVEHPENTFALIWDECGGSIITIRPFSASPSFLADYFKHKNIDVFVKTLYKYGFSKQKSSAETIRRYGKDILEFKHRYFRRGRVDLLHKVQTKINIREITSGFMGPNHYGPNKTMHCQEQFIRALSSASKHFQSLCEKVASLKQDILKKSEIKRFKSPKAILFEEDLCSRISTTSYLKKAGFVTYLGENGNDIIFKCSRKNFKIIILSINMLNILAILKKLSTKKRQGVLILTYKSNEMRNDFDELRKMGVDEFIPSPCSEEHFIATIERIEVFEDT